MALSLLVNIDVDDLKKGVEFYCAALGLTVGRRFGHDAVAPVGRDADASAQHDAIHERDVRLGVLVDQDVELVFDPPEFFRGAVALQDVLMDGDDISAGTECPVACSNDSHLFNFWIVAPLQQRVQDGAAHVDVQRIQGFRTVQGDEPQMPAALGQDLRQGPLLCVIGVTFRDEYTRTSK